nr:DNA-directed RNA polymerase subunit delta [Lentibacillus sp. JNUCC-1]
MKTVGQDELKKISMLELADMILHEEGKAMHFRDVFAKIQEIKGFSDDESSDRLAQFYTDLNLDGRFLTTGENMWGLKRWYPVEQIDEIITTESPKKTKTKKKKTKKKAEPVEEEAEDLETVDDDIDELTRNLAKGDEDEDTAFTPEYDDDYDEEFDDEDFDEDDEDGSYEDEEEEEEE